MQRSGHFPWLVTVFGVLLVVAVGLPSHLLAQLSQAVERGRIQASQDELARVNEVSQVFRLVAKVAKGGVVHIETRSTLDQGRISEIQDKRAEIYAQIFREAQVPDTSDYRSLREALEDSDMPESVARGLIRELIALDTEEERLLDRLGEGTGSGVVYDDQGHILTNNHVIDGRDEIVVHLNNEREYVAQVVGVDPESDLAVVKINATGLMPLAFGDSDTAEVGDWVLAVGAPFGLSQTVTHGIVSARGRTGINTGPERRIQYQDFIQTDAAINPGNSGGPLMNIRGEVIGINTAIATNGDSYNAGVAFTIPSNMVVKVAEQLKRTGQVARGWLGVRMLNLSDDAREIFEAERGGVQVLAVISDTPAERAGIQVEDVVTAIDGIPIRSSDEMMGVIADIFPGETARFDIMRGGRQQQLEVTLARRPPPREQRTFRGSQTHTVLSAEMLTLMPAAAVELGFDKNARGAVVVEASGELEFGDLITICNGRMVKTAASLAEQVRRAGSAPITLTVENSDGETRKVRLNR